MLRLSVVSPIWPRGVSSLASDLPFAEVALALLSGTSVVAALNTGHWFAAPFAALFMCGYAWVAFQVVREQQAARRVSLAPSADPSGDLAAEVARAA